MSLHLDEWLDAYLDGELTESQCLQAEKHIEECAACRKKVEQRRALSSLLLELPPATNLKPETRFAAEVSLLLPKHEGMMPGRLRLPNLMWWLAPAAILLVMAFIQTVLIVSSVAGWIPGIREALFSVSDFATRVPSLPSPLGGLLSFFNPLDGIGWGSLLASFTPFADISWSGPLCWSALLVMGILYLDWLVAWWMRRKNSRSHKENES